MYSSRDESLLKLSDAYYDVVVIGGGIHGAASARLAAIAGLKVALFERGDYAEATSSRSSKMAHGGLRYLEMFDFQQVFEGIKARENLFDAAPHVVRPERFLIPIPKGDWFLKVKLGIGLFLYDLMVKVGARRHRWIPRKKLAFEGFNSTRADLEGCYMYTDGLMNDARLVVENVRAARENGADCLNYAEVCGVRFNADERSWVVDIADRCGSCKSVAVKAKTILNCAGPWISEIKGADQAQFTRMKYSRGSHILFNKCWNGPSLFLPMEGKARYYFVWPHAAGTMVGTTEREVSEAARDPLPSKDEIDEIFIRLAKDLPGAGLNRDSAHHCFAGIRSLPLRSAKKGTTTLSRKHIWIARDGLFSLAGGKFTTASWTAAEGVNKVLAFLGKARLTREQRDSALPGACDSLEAGMVISRLVTEGRYSQNAAERLFRRLGARALSVLKYADGCREISEQVTEGEVRYGIIEEQAERLEDLMRRRLDLEYRYGHGLAELDEIGKIFKSVRPQSNFEVEKSEYVKRMECIHDLLLPSVERVTMVSGL